MRSIALMCCVATACYGMLTCSAAAELPLHIHSLVEASNEVREQDIVGRWSVVDHDASVEIEESLGGEFTVAVSFSVVSREVRRIAIKEFRGRRFRLEKRDYMELTSKSTLDLLKPEDFDPLAVSGIMLLSLEISSNTLKVRMIDSEKLFQVASKDEQPLEIVHTGRQLIVSSKAGDYRSLIAKRHDAVFGVKTVTLKRQK